MQKSGKFVCPFQALLYTEPNFWLQLTFISGTLNDFFCFPLYSGVEHSDAF